VSLYLFAYDTVRFWKGYVDDTRSGFIRQGCLRVCWLGLLGLA
jgi:hypothetical protein